MANVALLTRHSFSRTSSLADQPEVNCRRTRPEVEKAGTDVCDGVGLFRGGGAVVASPPPLPCRASDARRCAETGNGNRNSQTGSCCRPTSKHLRSSSTVDPISADELASLMVVGATGTGSDLTGSDVTVVVLDCRCFVAFNTNHVAGAFNAACADKYSRKRLTQGRATVADLVSDGPSSTDQAQVLVGGAREVFRRLAKTAAASPSGLFVAYDDDTTRVDALQESHPLRLLTASLSATGYRTKYLQGGLQAFHASYSLLCSSPDEPPSRPFLFSPTTPVVEPDVDTAQMSQILPFLFLGNERDASSRQLLRDAGIDHVLNVTSHVPLHFVDDVTMTYRRVPASDSGCQNLKQFFSDVVAFIESARCGGGKVLVHCQAGVSRSPTLVVAYLMALYGRPMMDTFNLVKERRPIVAPNFNFMGQLLEFEQRCRQGELRGTVDDSVPPPPLT